MLARRLEPPQARPRPRPGGPAGSPHPAHSRSAPWRGQGGWRRAPWQPTRDARGRPVAWWTRPAPRGDQALWRAVIAVQQERLRIGLPVAALARRLAAAGHPLRRETLSRLLQGKQATTWPTVEALAAVLDLPLDDADRPRAS